MMTKREPQELKILIQKPNRELARLKIKGIAPIIFSQFSQKAVRDIELKQSKKATALTKKAARDPKQEYFDSFYRDSEGYIVMPARNIKNAMVDTGKVLGIEMTLLKKIVWILGDIDGYIPVLVNGKKVKVEKMPDLLPEDQQPAIKRTTDLRYRGSFKNWGMELTMRYNGNVISLEQLMYLLQEAGTACGLGEWRNERNGDFGLFELDN